MHNISSWTADLHEEQFIGVRVSRIHRTEVGNNHEFVMSTRPDESKWREISSLTSSQILMCLAPIEDGHIAQSTLNVCVCMFTFKETEVCQFYFFPSACQKRVDSSKVSFNTTYNGLHFWWPDKDSEQANKTNVT